MTNGLRWPSIGTSAAGRRACEGIWRMNIRVPGKSLGVVFALAVLACFCGCSGNSSMGPASPDEQQIKASEKLVADPDRRLADVPVPLGAHFKSGASTSYETGSRRRVDHNYGIWANKSLVRRFYLDNMPVHGWKLTNSIAGQGTYNISYRKGRESCRVSIGPTNWCLQTQIEIIVRPVTDFD